jgi:hypothetical protein
MLNVEMRNAEALAATEAMFAGRQRCAMFKDR